MHSLCRYGTNEGNCKFCELVIHWKCASISEQTMKDIQQCTVLIWCCNGCGGQMEAFKPGSQLSVMGGDIKTIHESNAVIINQIKDLGKKFNKTLDNDDLNLAMKNLESKITMLQDELKNIKNIQDCNNVISGQIKKIKTILDKKITEDILDKKINSLQDGLRKSYSDAVKDVVGKKVETVNNEVMSMNDRIKALKEEVISTKKTIQLYSEVEERSFNFIIFKLKKSNNLSFNDSKKEDDEKIMRILSAITDEKFDMSNVVKHYRLGKRSDNVRPLLVRLKSKVLKNLIMESLNNLKNLDDDLKGIGIGHDMTKDQRIKCRELMNLAREKEAADKEDFVYKVRGEPGNLRIIRIKKRLH
ncbi:hypothetical protein HELRODRAFT_167983 [Helobdella robusta]|uniref:Zinc finger PHD-type domain-containing protein n=1 Tax=Helobdella robusta TaxID=6412 RepID=T1F014_HELRO|nr:hypothetical protein HELRODRAFT_167983 [Helobdella robusta]ESO10125.1 hypothetical protein HELRODRAFT_167983 [Helobdella robusta]